MDHPTSDAPHAFALPHLWEASLAMLNDGVLIADARRPGYPIVFCNLAFRTLSGYSEAEIEGQSCMALERRICDTANAENESALRQAQATFQDQLNRSLVLKGRRKDNVPFWTHVKIAPARDSQGDVTHFIAIHADITERKNAEEELHRIQENLESRVVSRTDELLKANERLHGEILERQQTEDALRDAEFRYRSIFENAVEGMYLSTPGGCYLSVNPALARLYGYPSPDSLVRGVRDIASQIYVDPEVRESFKRLMDTHGEVRGLEYKIRRVDGVILWISECARAVRNQHGEILFYEGTIQDITARKSAEAEKVHLEAQLRQSQKMEAIGTLAGGIAHDFNNILGIIMGYSELAGMGLPPQATAARHLGNVSKATHRARELVDQILAFSRRSTPEHKQLSLSPLIKESLKLLRASLPSTIDIQQNLLFDNDTVVADPTQLHQVLMNLCTNAAHAMRRKGGVLSISVREVSIPDQPAQKLTSLEPGSYLCLAVTDTGHGMDAATLERIFDPFFTTKPVGEGTGLGLSVVHGIVKSHRGEIAVQSEPGRGTTFEIYLPRVIQAESKSPAPASQLMGGTERILVVDDEPALVDVMKIRLEHLGYKVLGVSSGREALRVFNSRPGQFDLVLSDYTMPQMTGIELAQALFRVQPQLPFVLCTGYFQPSTESAAKNAGITHIIKKPVSFVELSHTIRTAINGTPSSLSSSSVGLHPPVDEALRSA